MSKRVAIFGSASCCGWCLVYEADDHQQSGVHALAAWYNTIEQWRKRTSDGTTYVYDDVDAAIAAHTTRGFEGSVSDLADLMAFYDADGQSFNMTLAEVLEAFVSDPTNDEPWPI